MKVFIDSNQFISDFRLEGAPMRYLFHYINNARHTLLLSRVVIEEVENTHRERVGAALAEARKVSDQMTQLGLAAGGLLASPKAPEPFSLRAALAEYVDDIVVVEYSEVPHEKVVARALARKKPFDDEGDTGYRDCLIWFSLLKHIAADNKADEVVFISSNRKDFYNTKGGKVKGAEAQGGAEILFHEHLSQDLALAGQTMTPYESVSSFVNSKVDRKEHLIDRSKVQELFGHYLQEQGLACLSQMDSALAASVIFQLFSLRSGLTILESHAETMEGIEDIFVEATQQLNNDEVFVECRFDIRGVSLDLFVPSAAYEDHRAVVDGTPAVWDVTSATNSLAIRLGVRPEFDASFRFNPRTHECTGFNLSSLSFRQRRITAHAS